MTSRLLGFFDSGLGGLTVLRRVLERQGSVPCVYLGDTARVPYGNRQPDDIRRIAAEVVGWLADQQACRPFWRVVLLNLVGRCRRGGTRRGGIRYVRL